MRFKFLILNYLTLISITVFSQGSNIDKLKNVIPPSPNASAIAKYTEWPVNLYTGLPSIDIPIYELKGKSVSVPISMTYHAGGNKVGDIASWIGLGWSINVGGIISRSVRGYPDEDQTGGYFVKRQLYSNQNDLCSSPTNIQLAKQHKVAVAKGEQDGEQDIYNFSALGKSFKFIFRADGTIVPVPYSNIKITTNFVTSQSNPAGVSWVVLLEDGTKLEFGGNGFVELNTSSRFDIGSSVFPTSWLLKKIISTTGEEIIFTYNLVAVQQDSYFSETDAIKYGISTYIGSPNQCPLYLEGDKKKPNSEKQSVIMLQVATIESESGRVEFIQNTFERLDLKGGKKLDAIKVYSKIENRYLFQYNFNHSYTDAVTGNEHLNGIHTSDLSYYRKRLRLGSFEKRNPNTNEIENIWRFNYNSQNLPSRRSYAQDHWGFYNGALSNTTLVPNYFYPLPANIFELNNNAGFNPPSFEKGGNREGNADYAKAEILESIEYPTGGKTTFYHEGNTISVNEEQFTSAIINGTSLNLSSLSNPYTNNTEVTFSISVRQNIQLNLTSYISNGIFNDNPNARVTATVFKIGQPNSGSGIANGTGISNFTGQVHFNLLEPGTYILRLSTNAVQESFGNNDAIIASCSVYFEQSLGSQNINKNSGGLRLSRMSIYDGVNSTKNIDKYYTYENPLIINPIDYKSMYFTDFEEVICQPNGMNCVYKVVNRTSSTRFSFGDIQGGSVGYGKVTTLNGLNGVNGKTITEFSNEQDYGISEVLLFPFPPTDPRPWRRGQILKQTDYSASNTKIKEMTKGYNFVNKSAVVSFKAGFTSYQQCLCTDIDGDCYIQKICYTTTSEQVKEIYTATTLYDQNGTNPLTTTVTNYYDNSSNTQPTRIETTDSKGNIVKNIIRTPLEKHNILSTVTLSGSASSAIDTMLSRNIIAVPLMEEKYVGTKLISQSLLNYKNWTSTLLAPENVQIKNGNNPIETRVQFNSYDLKGNLLEQQKVNDVVQSYLYAYNKNYPIAQAVNAKSNELFHENFEESTLGWSNNTPVIDYSFSRTGKGSGRIDNPTSGEYVSHAPNWLNVTITTPAKYKYSGWVYSNGPSAELFFFMKYNKNSSQYFDFVTAVGTLTTNKWTYIEGEYTVPAGITALQMRLDNNGGGRVWFDDLRIYPSASQMTTYTYAPLIGITSQTDVNNRSTYYEYDGFNRLMLVRDNDKNVLKKYCYNYAGQTESCQLFGNQDQSGIFYSQNCQSGQTAEGVYVSIPANQYYSTVSQADANAQAIQYGQSYANQNGTCTSSDFDLKYTNYTNAFGSVVELYNTSTGQYYYFQMSFGGGILGSISAGNYDVTVYPSYYDYYSCDIGCGYYAGGWGSVSFFGIPLNPSCNSLNLY